MAAGERGGPGPPAGRTGVGLWRGTAAVFEPKRVGERVGCLGREGRNTPGVRAFSPGLEKRGWGPGVWGFGPGRLGPGAGAGVWRLGEAAIEPRGIPGAGLKRQTRVGKGGARHRNVRTWGCLAKKSRLRAPGGKGDNPGGANPGGGGPLGHPAGGGENGPPGVWDPRERGGIWGAPPGGARGRDETLAPFVRQKRGLNIWGALGTHRGDTPGKNPQCVADTQGNITTQQREKKIF